MSKTNNNFFKALNKYELETIAPAIARASIHTFYRLFNRDEESDQKYKHAATFEIVDEGKIYDTVLYTWEFHIFTYFAVLNCSIKGAWRITDQELSLLVNKYRSYYNNLNVYDKEKGICKFLSCTTYEQFKCQAPNLVIEQFNRVYHILIASKKVDRNNIKPIAEIMNEVLGITVEEYLKCLILICEICLCSPYILTAPQELFAERFDEATVKNVKKIVEYYTIDVLSVKNSEQKERCFYSKPFLRYYNKKDTILTSSPLIFQKLGDGLFWIIREYYSSKKEKQIQTKFVNTFGLLFEQYFFEVCNCYLPDSCFKIPEGQYKTPDFMLKVGRHTILAELKSSLLPISAKTQFPDLAAIEDFLKRTVEKASKQLAAFTDNINTVKFIVLFEDLPNISLVEHIDANSSARIATISDMERLLSLAGTDIAGAGKILDRVLKDDNRPSLQQILNEEHIPNKWASELSYFNDLTEAVEV
ncbi:MAG: hypothetical protein LBM28_01410 [Oscillospiraceae bacterium]|jgi:hypothetical protein|nr:hypothetical protein [Oscillospiraceae bacterium]